jgi:hypothetical protein
MNTIFDYCIGNLEELKNYKQSSFTWRDQYNVEEFLRIPEFSKIEPDIPDLIDREHILKSIRDGRYYQAYVEILLWGLIGSRPGSNKSKKTEIASEAFFHPISEINNIFNVVKTGNQENIEKLYTSLERNGTKKIKEVDVSYFTKILSFASEAFKNAFKLLIYDKWTRLIHVHILLDMNKITELDSYYSNKSISDLYSISKSGKKPSTKLIYAKSNKSLKVYFNYCDIMATLARQISEKSGLSITSFQLEAFLFGKDLKSKMNKNNTNPRYWIQKNFAEKYLGGNPQL